MRPFFSSAVVLASTLSLAGCPGDDSGDDSNDSANDSTTETTTTAPTTDASATNPSTGTDTTPDTTEDGGDSTGELILGDIDVVVNYDGEATGLLNVVAMTAWPPVGPPLAAASEMDGTFPWAGTLNNLEAGEVFVAAVLDVGADSPTMPGPEDLVAVTEAPVVIDGEGPFMVELTLMDP